MNAPNADELDAIQRLATRPEGRVYLEYLERSASTVAARLAKEHDAVVMRILQGHAQALDILLKAWKP